MESYASIRENLPPYPMDEESVLAAHSLLEKLRQEPVKQRRITRHRRVVNRLVALTADESGLEYTPTKKSKRQIILFSDLYEVSKEDPSSKLYRKAGLHAQNDVVVNLRTRAMVSWRLALESEREAQVWMNFIGFQLGRFGTQALTRRAKTNTETDSYLRQRLQVLWDRADADHDGRLTLLEVKKQLVLMNVEMGSPQLKKVFTDFDVSGDGTLDLEEFTELFTHLTTRPELKEIFAQFVAQPDAGMTVAEFTNFLISQGDSLERTEALFQLLGPNPSGYLSFQSFCTYLTDPKMNSAMQPQHFIEVVDDMSHPMVDYFINSSHNTYLTGDQLKSSSSVEMYVRALQAGCKCVELDCWDGPDSEPVVYHGYTRTSKITFVDAIQAIQRHAFKVSPYPLTLSLEVHTSPAQCNVMAAYLQTVFGDSLLRASELSSVDYSPKGLQGRVIVKWKLPGDTFIEEVEEDNSREDSTAPASFSASAAASGSTSQGQAASPTCDALSHCVGMGSCSSRNWGKDAKKYNVQSFVESKVKTLAEEHSFRFIEQNTRMMSRVYPKGNRITSSNYNPTMAWAVGCQLVAMNYQTWDDNMQLNDGMFRQNAACGYVLKPLYLRSPGACMATPCTLIIRVICGSFIPKPSLERKGDIVDPYVKLRINGRGEHKTAIINNNGLTPYWDETFTLVCPSMEVDILTVKVMDQDTASSNDDVCSACVPVHALRTGYRAFMMKLCSNGTSLFGTSILCHITKVLPQS